MRLTLEEYSKHFKMSKEMINSKLRSKKLNYIIEDGVTYIIVTRSSLEKEKRQEIHQEQKATAKETKKTSQVAKPKTTVAMILGLYQKENHQLKEKIVQLEAKIDKLIDDKEQMLRDEMTKIEQVYTTKDAQLKNILELVNTKLLAEKENTIHDVDTISVEEEPQKKSEILELKKYLKGLDLENYQQKIIKKRFLAVYGKDIRVIKQNGKIYLDFSKYDYSDLLEY
jgi:hypothetical protein